MRATFPIRDSPFFTFRLLPDQPPYRSLSEERLFDEAPSEGAESPLLMRDSFEGVKCFIQPGGAHVPVRAGVHVKVRNADWRACLLSVTHDPRMLDPRHVSTPN